MASEVEAKGRASVARRRFTLLDSMILVAATAAGYAVVQAFNGLIQGGSLLGVLRDAAASGAILQLGLILLLIALPVLAAWTVALIPLRLIGPRPRWRRLARQPGLMAGLAVTTSGVFLAILVALIVLGLGVVNASALVEAIVLLPAIVGLAVLVSWTTLIAGRRWRPEPSWLDRLGRALGAFWILLGLASPLLLLFT